MSNTTTKKDIGKLSLSLINAGARLHQFFIKYPNLHKDDVRLFTKTNVHLVEGIASHLSHLGSDINNIFLPRTRTFSLSAIRDFFNVIKVIEDILKRIYKAYGFEGISHKVNDNFKELVKIRDIMNHPFRNKYTFFVEGHDKPPIIIRGITFCLPTIYEYYCEVEDNTNQVKLNESRMEPEVIDQAFEYIEWIVSDINQLINTISKNPKSN